LTRLLFLDPIGHVLGAHDHALCSQLARMGYDVTLGTNDVDAGPAAPTVYRRRVVYDGIVGDGWRLAKLGNYLRCQRRLLRELRGQGYDAVLQYYVIEPHLDGAFLRALRRRGLPSVLCVHDVLPLHRDSDFLGAWRRAYAAAGRLAVFSAFARDRLVRDLGFEAASIEVGSLGIERLGPGEAVGREAARRRLGIPLDERMVMSFGQIKRSKGVEFLLRAFAELAPDFPAARLWIVGRPLHLDVGPLESEIRRLGLQQRVELRAKSVEPADVALWFEAADLVVLPYVRLYQSDVLLRAVAHGRPVVATSVGNTPELIRSGETGWLVPPRDPAALAGAMRQALSAPDEAASRGLRAREELQGRSSWPALAERLGAAVSAAMAAARA